MGTPAVAIWLIPPGAKLKAVPSCLTGVGVMLLTPSPVII